MAETGSVRVRQGGISGKCSPSKRKASVEACGQGYESKMARDECRKEEEEVR